MAALNRALAYKVARARSDEEVAQLEREYERLSAEGPDFTRIRKRSDFREAPAHKMDGNELARLRVRFNNMARGAWEQRDMGRHRGVISRTCRDVMNAIIRLAERHRRVFPSLLGLAQLAQCSKTSVAKALNTLEALGWITRHRRIRMVEGLLGRKAEQITNGYELHEPRTALGRLGFLVFVTESESKRATAKNPELLSYLKDHPESWGSPGIARCDAHGERASPAHF